jgi:hypothetical protein
MFGKRSFEFEEGFLQRELASQAYHSAGQCWPKVSDVCARAPWERESR